MRVLSTLLVAVLFGVFARAQVSNRVWAAALKAPVAPNLSPGAENIRFTKLQLRRFVNGDCRKYQNLSNEPEVWGWCHPDRLRIGLLDRRYPHIFVVSPTPFDKNPAWWLLQVEAKGVKNLTPTHTDRPTHIHLDFSVGYPSVLKPVHNGLHDLAIVRTVGAPEEDLTYLKFDGTRYRAIASQHFKWCSETPGHADISDDRWCLANGTIVGNRQ
jgi:hypothetical protein